MTPSQSADGTTNVTQNGVDLPPTAASLMERSVDVPDGFKSLPRGFVLDDPNKWFSDLLDGKDKVDILLFDLEDSGKTLAADQHMCQCQLEMFKPDG